ncbi:hypothetical protein AAFF_G00437250 [Aldrovandia affinis]|uniref:Uncharacterized protein n=1 Tax=Aldrovandia affinis TaxID=143900 RepID=A0AAD7S7P8_9TELE|nr:hypothetical protein AAFF_G00437250 [Aldrovandia affinis]
MLVWGATDNDQRLRARLVASLEELSATPPSMDKCTLPSMSQSPFRRVEDSTKLDPNSQSGSITDSVKCLSPASSENSKRGQEVRSPCRHYKLSSVKGKGKGSLKCQVMTRTRKIIGQLERPLKCLTVSSENGICAEASHSSPVMSPRNQNTGGL